MTNIENYFSIAHRTGYASMPVHFDLCPMLRQKFSDYIRETGFICPENTANITDLAHTFTAPEEFLRYYDHSFKPGTTIDMWGIAHEPGSAAAFHMTRMHHPMANFDSVDQVMDYPIPVYSEEDDANQKAEIESAHARDLVAVGNMAMTVWEQSWYLRGMENLMADMMDDDPIAEAIFDRVTETAVRRAESYAKNGADLIALGDDIGMQRSILMSESLYCEWIKPRLAKVIAAAKAVKPDILIQYHSCGFVTPMIPHLIDAGVEILNPIQPECMNFAEIHEMYGDRLSFNGTIGTQTTMPFGTPEEVRREVFKNLEIAGDKGGLFCAPTHMLEPEVPVENLVAYINACKEFK